MSGQELKLDQQIKQAEHRNKYLRNTIKQMKQALGDHPSVPTKQQAGKNSGNVNLAALKQLQTIEKNIAIAQKQFNKLKGTPCSLDELMIESDRLQKAIGEQNEEKKRLWNQIVKVKKQVYLKHRDIEDPQGAAKVKVDSYQLQIKVLNKKLSLLSTTSKPTAKSLLARNSSTQQPVKRDLQTLPQISIKTPVDKYSKEQLGIYTNLIQSYQRKLEQLTAQVSNLELKQKQREREEQSVEKQIEEWMGKIEQIKKGIAPSKYRKLTEKKLVKLI